MAEERIFCQDDLRGLTPAEIVDEVAALRARLEAAERERDALQAQLLADHGVLVDAPAELVRLTADRDLWKALAERLADALQASRSAVHRAALLAFGHPRETEGSWCTTRVCDDARTALDAYAEADRRAGHARVGGGTP